MPADPTPTPDRVAGAPRPATAPAASPAGSPASAAAVVDPALLRHLPAAVDGFPLAPDPTTAATVAADPTLAANAEAIAMAIVVAPGSTGDDLAVASVVRLRPGVDNPIFREIFRAAYDRVACEQAGGVGRVRERDDRRSRRPRRVLHGRRHDLPRPPRRRAPGVGHRRSGRASSGEQIVADLQE